MGKQETRVDLFDDGTINIAENSLLQMYKIIHIMLF